MGVEQPPNSKHQLIFGSKNLQLFSVLKPVAGVAEESHSSMYDEVGLQLQGDTEISRLKELVTICVGCCMLYV